MPRSGTRSRSCCWPRRVYRRGRDGARGGLRAGACASDAWVGSRRDARGAGRLEPSASRCPLPRGRRPAAEGARAPGSCGSCGAAHACRRPAGWAGVRSGLLGPGAELELIRLVDGGSERRSRATASTPSGNAMSQDLFGRLSRLRPRGALSARSARPCQALVEAFGGVGVRSSLCSIESAATAAPPAFRKAEAIRSAPGRHAIASCTLALSRRGFSRRAGRREPAPDTSTRLATSN